MNPGPFEYEAVVLTVGQRRSFNSLRLEHYEISHLVPVHSFGFIRVSNWCRCNIAARVSRTFCGQNYLLHVLLFYNRTVQKLWKVHVSCSYIIPLPECAQFKTRKFVKCLYFIITLPWPTAWYRPHCLVSIIGYHRRMWVIILKPKNVSLRYIYRN